MTEGLAEKQRQSFRGRAAMIVLLGLCLVGAAVSVQLAVIYHKSNADLAHQSHCAVDSKWDCDDVARSKYAAVLGVPVALWGLLGYGVMGLFAAWGARGRAPRHFPLGILSILVLCALGMAAYLAWVSAVILKTKCQYCAVLYGVNLALLAGLLWAFIARRKSPITALREDLRWLLDRLNVSFALAAGILGAVALALVLGPRLGRPSQDAPQPAPVENLVKKAPSVSPGPMRPGETQKAPRPLPKGKPPWVKEFVASDTPARGPVDADLYIVEFSDYECPFCQLSNAEVEKVLAKYGQRIRLYHRHFPLDMACFKQMRRPMHQHACFAAAASICAHAQGKFWTFHDRLFRLGKSINRESIRELARTQELDMGAFEACLVSPKTGEHLQRDIEAAVRKKIRGTPAFFMGGPLVEPSQPTRISLELFDRLFAAIDEEKRRRTGSAVPAASAAETKTAEPMAPQGTPP